MLALKIFKIPRYSTLVHRYYSNAQCSTTSAEKQFDTVYSLPYIRYIALFNRLKVFHMFGSGITASTCGLLEIFNLIPEQSFLTAAYVGVTGIVVLSLASLPTRNIIGFLYCSEDKEHVKISSVTYWGIRKDSTIKTSDWVPLMDLPPKRLDPIFVKPRLVNGTEYKLLVLHGKIHNQQKMTEIFS